MVNTLEIGQTTPVNVNESEMIKAFVPFRYYFRSQIIWYWLVNSFYKLLKKIPHNIFI